MVQVTQVKLGDRARTRLNQEVEAHRAQKPHDIRMAIPQGVDWTNPAKFPPYMFREYPKMPLLDGNRPIVIDEVGTILVFFDASDEADFKHDNPEIAEEIDRNAPAKTMAETLAMQQAQIDELKKRLQAAGLDVSEPKKGGNKLSNAIRGEGKPTEAVEAAQTTSGAGGLRETLPSNQKAKEAASTAQEEGGNPLRRQKRAG